VSRDRKKKREGGGKERAKLCEVIISSWAMNLQIFSQQGKRGREKKEGEKKGRNRIYYIAVCFYRREEKRKGRVIFHLLLVAGRIVGAGGGKKKGEERERREGGGERGEERIIKTQVYRLCLLDL